MKQIILTTILLTGFISSFAQNQNNLEPAASTGLSFTLLTNKDRYALGERIIVTLTWQNTTNKDFEIRMTPMIDGVSVYDEETKKELPYRGMIICGGGANKNITASEKFELQNAVNDFLYPNFDLTKPGRYTVKSTYSSNNIEKRKNFWTGQLSSTATFEVFRLDEATLNRIREKAVAGDKQALQVLAAHGDEIIIPTLAELIKSKDKDIRETVYQALLIINTDNSIRLLAEATNANIPPQEKLNILRALFEAKPTPNPVVIPYMEKLLTDNYVGAHSTTNNEGEPSRRFKQFTVRKWAYYVLQKLNIETQVVYEEEVKEEAVKDKSQ